jgi:uncharacterized protein (DUF433 family)
MALTDAGEHAVQYGVWISGSVPRNSHRRRRHRGLKFAQPLTILLFVELEKYTMTFPVVAEPPPLREDVDGALRVGNSRVLLELVIRAFQDGATPETIVQRYSTLALADVYAVIAYYLRHPPEIEEYLDRREERANKVARQVEQESGNLSEIRRRLLAQRQTRR